MSDPIDFIPDLSSEFQFIASRSSGPGGQNVNKVNSKVEVRFDLRNSGLLSDEQKEVLLVKLDSKLTAQGILIAVSQRDRSQLVNKEDAINKLYGLIAKALRPVKARKKTRPTKSSVEKRLSSKRINSITKQYRSKIDD